MRVIGITLPMLHKHYRAEFDRGAAVVEAKLAGLNTPTPPVPAKPVLNFEPK